MPKRLSKRKLFANLALAVTGLRDHHGSVRRLVWMFHRKEDRRSRRKSLLADLRTSPSMSSMNSDTTDGSEINFMLREYSMNGRQENLEKILEEDESSPLFETCKEASMARVIVVEDSINHDWIDSVVNAMMLAASKY